MLKIKGLYLPMIADEIVTGDVYWVSSTTTGASDDAGSGRSPDRPFATLAAAISAATASTGDIIVVLPGHAETASAVITVSVAGLRIIGVGVGRNRPAFTAAAAARDLVNITGANTLIQNIRFIGAASGCTALVNIGASDGVIRNCVFDHAAAPLMAVTVSAGDRWVIDGCRFLGTAANPDCSIDLEAKCRDWVVQNCTADYTASAGLDLAFVRSNAKAQPGGMVAYNTVLGCNTMFLDINSSAAATGDGLVVGNRIAMYAALTSIEDCLDLGGWMPVDNLATDEATKTSARIPIVTAS